MTTSALPSELNDDAHSHSGRHQLHKEHSGDLEAHFLHVGPACPAILAAANTVHGNPQNSQSPKWACALLQQGGTL